MGITLTILGIWYEKPIISAIAIFFLLFSLSPGQIISRILLLKFEFISIIILIVLQLMAESQFNAVILVLYLMGLINGALLPDPRALKIKNLRTISIIFIIVAIAAEKFDILRYKLPGMSSSTFGSDPENYVLDFRSLGYGVFIILIYLTPIFDGIKGRIQSFILAAIAALSTNKFGIIYSIAFKFPVKISIFIFLILFFTASLFGFSQLSFTETRAALWSDFFTRYSECTGALGVCTDLISNNNEEGVRSFHSIPLDFLWYGGMIGLIAAIYFILKIFFVKSIFGESGPFLFAISMIFGFPPFFNERHILVAYAFFVLFQKINTDNNIRRAL